MIDSSSWVRACCCLVCGLALGASVLAAEVDGIAARVGSETVLRSDVINEMRRLGLRDDVRFNEIRNEIIDRKLILKAAADAKMTMQDWIVENRIREIVTRAFGGDRNRLIESLSQQRVSYPEWRARMKEDMVVSAMRWNVVDKNVTASPSAMRKMFAEHPERYVVGRKVTVDVITLRPDEKARREEISTALKDKSFADLGGKTYTDITPEDMFNAEICKELAAMPKGTISHWLEIDGWSFLLRKNAESPGRQSTFAEAYETVEADVREEAARRLYKAWIERLRAETFIRTY